MNEVEHVKTILANYPLDKEARFRVSERAARWLSQKSDKKSDFVTDLLQGFELNSPEGRSMMELAEAYLRVPDPKLQKQLLRDKISAAGWHTNSANNNVARFTARAMKLAKSLYQTPASSLSVPVEKVITKTLMEKLAGHFVCGRTITEAVKNVQNNAREREVYSFDMLGEGARTYEDATRYFNVYLDAIAHIKGVGNMSVKLSALHPHFEETHRDICFDDLLQKIILLGKNCKDAGINMRIDAEEERRLDMMIDLVDHASQAPELQNWDGLGLAIQAYLKRTPHTIERLQTIAKRDNRSFGVRLVKGAYWDTEIKYAQEMGHEDFPVFTRKRHTDLSYVYCAHLLLEAPNLRPAFGSHNAMSLAAVVELANQDKDLFETQRLVGMGDDVHEAMRDEGYNIGVYAPVGAHEDLLPYLVRRLLENGANTSFLKQSGQNDDSVFEEPYDLIKNSDIKPHDYIKMPVDLYKTHRNSLSPDLGHFEVCTSLQKSINIHVQSIKIDEITNDDTGALDQKFENAHKAFQKWRLTTANDRADLLEKFADTLNDNRDILLGYLQAEAGKTIHDAIAEWREAIDFCRYYARCARLDFIPQSLNSPEGETNIYTREGRGVFITIAPWNFPLAIFVGQVVAALAAGNCVIAKPSEETPHIGDFVIKLMHKSGFPKDVVTIALGDGKVGAYLTNHPKCDGIAFTGSFTTGKIIQRAIAARDGAMIPFIAETAGLNAMAVDSTALPEQVVDDIIHSAFGSAGQRCSALRILIIEDKAAKNILPLLSNAIRILKVDDPSSFSTDVGPIVSNKQAKDIKRSVSELKAQGSVIAEAPLNTKDPRYIAPIAIDMSEYDFPNEEIFGPVLQVYRVKSIKDSIEAINKKGYALTFGIHTRLGSNMRMYASMINAGNIYINRGMTGAVVGVQPFGGFGLSGTGPKAGGPDMLRAFARERVITTDITAAGGNASLVAKDETSTGGMA